MKFAKLSIAALAVVGFSSSAMALDMSGVTAKPFAGVKLYYETVESDATGSDDLFAQGSATTPGGASGQAAVNVGLTGSLDKCWGYGLEGYMVDTLGLENNVVSRVRMGQGLGTDSALDTQAWASQAYVTYNACGTVLSNTTLKIGRQYLDTPFAFTENWNIAPNSFDAIVALNQDIKNVTLVGAYVGKGNGAFASVTNGSKFDSYATVTRPAAISGKGAYAVGALTNFIDGLPINVWYYDLPSIATAAWIDAGYSLKVADDTKVGLGAQYGMMSPSTRVTDLVATADDTSGFAVKANGKVGMFSLMAAYSSIDDNDGNAVLPLGNTATSFKKTKLYTAGVYNDGTAVAVPGSDALKVKAGVNLGFGKVAVQYITCENDNKASGQNVDEIDVILGTKIAGIGAKLIYINRDVTEGNNNNNGLGLGDSTQHVRIILSKKF
ncbi:MAG: OprD family outer membrane porin [Epsilonproteobacteria bacterium]|nr:OprD family outer membrane porin [Campylobacterota bacterium]